ncbi:MAG: PAS domain-containing protein [Balneola sp.]
MSLTDRLSVKSISIIAVSTLIVLIVSNQLLIQKILDEKRDDATVINLAGRQRMLSQKIAKTVYLAENNDINLDGLKQDLEIWAVTHNGLKNGNEVLGIEANQNDLIQTLFSETELHYEAIRTSLSNFSNREEVIEAIPVIRNHEEQFLEKMDEIVKTFEAISNESVRSLIRLEVILGLFSLFIIGGEIYLIFRVFIARIRNKNEELEKSVQELSDSKGDLFEYVQRFELSLKAINAGIWDWYLEDNSEWWSPRFYEMLGYVNGEIEASYNTFLNILLHRDDKERVVTAVEEHLKSGTPYKLEIRMKNKSGEYRWFETVGQASFDTDGNPIRMVGSIIDIQNRILIEEEKKELFNTISETRTKLEEAQEIAKIGNWNWEMKEDIITWSDQNYRVFGQSKDFTPTFEQLNELIPEEEREPFQKDVERAIAENIPHDFIHRIVINEGREVRYIHERGKVFYDEEGTPYRMAGTSQDVTESVLKEKQLEAKTEEVQRSIALLSETQKAAKIGSWEVDLGTMTAFWSDEVYRIHEVEPGTPIKVEEGINFYREDFRPVIQNAIDGSIKNKSSWDVECVLITKKGNEIWVRAIGHPVFENGQLTGLRGLFMDIDETKTKSIELDETNEKLQLSVEAGQIAIWIWDLNTNELEWNDQAYKVFGVPDNFEPTFEKFGTMVHPEDLDYVVQATQKTVETGEKLDIEFRWNRPDGKEIILTGRGDIVRDEDGNPVQMIGINMDITERMRLLENIQLKESQLRSFVEQAPAAVAMLDTEMKYITVSNQWFKQYNLDKKDLVGISHYDIFPEINEMPEWLEQHQRVLNGEELSNPKDKIVRKDGTVQWISWKLIPWYNEPGEIGGMIMYTADITSEVYYTEKLEKEVANRTKELASVNEELESFSYSISHDLRAPLRSINGFSDILMEDYADQLDSEGKRLMGVVKESAVTMGQLIDDILEFSRLGKKKIQKSEIDMNRLFESICEVEASTYSDKQIDVKIDDLPNALGDVALIKQVVVNLVSNAFKYSSKKDEININIGSDKNEEKGITYFVKDNGTGFKMEYHDKLFGVFNRLHSKNEFDGTGVGLAIVKRIINKHGGEIWAESAEGIGSTFFFSMPNS